MPKLVSNSPLVSWINGMESLQSFVDKTRLNIDSEFGGWLALFERLPAHESVNSKAQSVDEAWLQADEYIKNSLDIIHTSSGEIPEEVYIDHEDRFNILEKNGLPPGPCMPIYMFTVVENGTERIVYIGKTNSTHSRFKSGHAIAIKLLDPKYNNCQKFFYSCQVMFLATNGDYLPLEWLNPRAEIHGILDNIESKLIYHFQPELNVNKRSNISKVANNVSIHIVNYTDINNFLKDTHI